MTRARRQRAPRKHTKGKTTRYWTTSPDSRPIRKRGVKPKRYKTLTAARAAAKRAATRHGRPVTIAFDKRSVSGTLLDRGTWETVAPAKKRRKKKRR